MIYFILYKSFASIWGRKLMVQSKCANRTPNNWSGQAYCPRHTSAVLNGDSNHSIFSLPAFTWIEYRQELQVRGRRRVLDRGQRDWQGWARKAKEEGRERDYPGPFFTWQCFWHHLQIIERICWQFWPKICHHNPCRRWMRSLRLDPLTLQRLMRWDPVRKLLGMVLLCKLRRQYNI